MQKTSTAITVTNAVMVKEMLEQQFPEITLADCHGQELTGDDIPNQIGLLVAQPDRKPRWFDLIWIPKRDFFAIIHTRDKTTNRVDIEVFGSTHHDTILKITQALNARCGMIIPIMQTTTECRTELVVMRDV